MSWYQTDKSPRESFARYPMWMQWIITFIGGKPMQYEKPLIWINPIIAIMIDVLKLLFGILLSILLFKLGRGGYVFIPLSWLLTVNGARSIASDAHYAGHCCITKKKSIDHWIGEALSIIILSSNIHDYSTAHRQHHGQNGIHSQMDPDLEPMLMIGFETGKPHFWYWCRMFLTLVSPRYHVVFLIARIKSNFFTAVVSRRIASLAVYFIMAAVVIFFNTWVLWLIVWFIPIIVLYAQSAALQFPSEHLWLAEMEPSESKLEFKRRISHGRFFLISAPKQGLNSWECVVAWIGWCTLMIPKLFGRFFVCASVLPAHDYHHRHVLTLDWPMESYLRQIKIDNGTHDYIDYYSLISIYKKQFSIWANLSPNLVEKRFTFLGFFMKS